MFRFLRRFLTDPALQKKKAFLSSLDLFKELRGRELGHLVKSLHSRVYKEGEVIFMEGDIGRALFILETGKVFLTKKDQGGKMRKLFTLEPGDFFGEMALLEQLPRTATATASERSVIHLLYRSDLEEILTFYPRVGVTIMTYLAQLMSSRLRHASKMAMLQQSPTNYG